MRAAKAMSPAVDGPPGKTKKEAPMKQIMMICASGVLAAMLAACSVVHTPREYNLWLTD